MANFNFNKVIIGGRLVNDPELKTTPGGVSVTTFTIAVNRNYKGHDEKQEANFFNVIAWRQTAEFITRFFRKASSICVVGSIQSRTWTDQQGQKRYGVEIVADEAYFVDAKSEMPEFQSGPPTEPVEKMRPEAFSTPGARAEIAGGTGDLDEEMPF